MKRRTKLTLLAGGLAVATGGATVMALSVALGRSIDRMHLCDTGLPAVISCSSKWSSTSTGRSSPIFAPPSTPASTDPSSAPDTFQPNYVSVTSWAVADCPGNAIARRLLCAAPAGAASAPSGVEDHVTGLPLPKPWLLRTAKNSPLMEAIHVETPLDLAAALGFYRIALRQRGWTENDNAVVEPERAVVAFTTAQGPALLRLIHRDGITAIDLSLRKPAATVNAGTRAPPGRARLMLGNSTDEEAVITINAQTITLAARAGHELANAADPAGKLPDGQKIDLPPGKYKVSLKVASGTAQNREFEVAADETWGLLAGPAGAPLPLHLY